MMLAVVRVAPRVASRGAVLVSSRLRFGPESLPECVVSLFDAAGDAVDAGASSARGGSDVSVSVRLNGLWKPGIARESRVAEW